MWIRRRCCRCEKSACYVPKPRDISRRCIDTRSATPSSSALPVSPPVIVASRGGTQEMLQRAPERMSISLGLLLQSWRPACRVVFCVPRGVGRLVGRVEEQAVIHVIQPLYIFQSVGNR